MFKRGGRSESTRRRALFILPIWTAFMIWMWSWWLQSGRAEFLPIFVPLTFAMLYEFVILPALFLYFILKAKEPGRRVAQKNLKVAMISPCIPAKESLEIIEAQLIAMKAVEYPHDSWILDEGGSKKVKKLAKKHGVLYFSRKGIKKYNQLDAPFKKKTKAGNVNAWLDRVKRRKYDYFVQLDIDHLPKPNYLNKTLGHFRDEKIGWVQAPSVYGNHQYWTARGSSEQELVLQGPLQMGFYGHDNIPFIIGSHTTYRMSAVMEMGGYQPTRAEDHLDTVTLAANGYRGVFLPEIIAVGDGPENLDTYLNQQYAWAYSMTQVLLHHTPRLIKGMKNKERLVFLFAQTWYPLWAFSYLIMFMAPVLSLLLNQDVANMTARDFFIHFVPTFAAGFAIWWAARPIMQPADIGLSWRGMLLHVVRWPVIIKAIFSASFGITKSYMITPKGKNKSLVPHMQTYRPFLYLGFISVFSIIFSMLAYSNPNILSQILYAASNAILMFTVCLVELKILYDDAPKKLHKTHKATYWLKPVAISATGMVLLLSSVVSAPIILAQTERNLTSNTNSIKQTKHYDQMNIEELINEIRNTYAVPSAELPTTGNYDPNKTIDDKGPILEHEFANWNDSEFLARRILEIKKSGNVPVITLEPREPGVDGTTLLKNITSGEYDAKLAVIRNILNASDSRTYIRFAHEMDLGNLYPWGAKNPQDYTAAFRYVESFMSRGIYGQNLIWIWSPAGNQGAEKYYPGDDVVDIVGVTVLYDKYWYQDAYVPFSELAGKRLWLKQLDKPLWIAEFGVGTSNAELQAKILKEGLSQYDDLGFDSILYLNIRDSNIIGPDYRLHKQNLDVAFP